MTILTATVTKVQIGILEIDGLLLEDGSFGVAVHQANDLLDFSASNKTASRDIKRLLGERFNASKVKVKSAKQEYNCILLVDFESLLFELSVKGNQKAIALTRSLVGLSLTQLFSDAFGIKFEKEDRQQWLQQRQQGKAIRRT